MSSVLVLTIVVGYFLILIIIARLTAKNADTQTFFTANRQSPWYLVAFGMIGSSISGVAFISVPAEVGNSSFSYFQVVLGGYLLGFLVIALVLTPLYYRLKLISIYGYLKQRFGFWSYKTGSAFFLFSRLLGAGFRLFLVAMVLQTALFDDFEVPFWVSVLVTILLIWVYTYKGGIRTIVWSDSLQTVFMLAAIGITIFIITREMDLSIREAIVSIKESPKSQIFDLDWKSPGFFPKQFISGALIAIVLSGLDQDMMQKTLTCQNLKEAQKNILSFSTILIFINLLLLGLGALLYLYVSSQGIEIPTRIDLLYPTVALNHLETFAGVVFLLGITAAAYSSADSSLTALTTAFCVDFLQFEKLEEADRKKIHLKVHIVFSLLLFLVILIFNTINDNSIINTILLAAGYTYGPLLGLFSFGILTNRSLIDKYVLPICISAPILSYLIDSVSNNWFGFFILALNGGITFLGLLLISTRKHKIDFSPG